MFIEAIIDAFSQFRPGQSRPSRFIITYIKLIYAIGSRKRKPVSLILIGLMADPNPFPVIHSGRKYRRTRNRFPASIAILYPRISCSFQTEMNDQACMIPRIITSPWLLSKTMYLLLCIVIRRSFLAVHVARVFISLALFFSTRVSPSFLRADVISLRWFCRRTT